MNKQKLERSKLQEHIGEKDEVICNLNLSIENLYLKNIENISHHYKTIEFVSVKHNNSYTPGWNNNKLLILKKN